MNREKKTQGTAAKSLDLANTCCEAAESCPLGLIYLHYTPSIWVKNLLNLKKNDHTLTVWLWLKVCLIEWFSDHNLLMTQWIILTLFCVPKRWVWSMACTAHPTRTRLSAKATSESSCQVYPHMLPAFNTLIILSVSASYSYLKAPVGKRQSWEKGIIPPFRSDLKTFSQASTILWHQLQTFAITHMW